MIWQGIDPDISNIHNGLLGYYNFEEDDLASPFGDGVDANDVPAFGGVASTSGLVGDARFFDRVSDYGSLGSNIVTGQIYDFGPNDSFTISVWVNISDTTPSTDQIICSKHDTNPVTLETSWDLTYRGEQSTNLPSRFGVRTYNDATLGVRTETITGKFNTGFGFQGEPYDILPGRWYHIVAGYDADANHTFIYVNNSVSGAPNAVGESDGELGARIVNDAAISQGLGASSTNAGFAIAAHHTSNNKFGGIIDALGIWNRVLASGEIKALYNNGQGLALPYTDFPPSGTTAVGGLVHSKTPNNLTSSGFIGGHLFAPRQYGPSGIPQGIEPFIGGRVFAATAFPAVKIGGRMFSKPRLDQRNNVYVGGYTKAPGFQNSQLVGGFILSQPLTGAPTGFIGGIGSGLNQFGPQAGPQGQVPRLGGWTFGRPTDTSFVEQHSRTLVKARSEDVVDQALNIDNQIVLFQRENANFYGRIGVERTAQADFNAQIAVKSFRLRPTSEVTVTKVTTSGVTEIEVQASGIPGEDGTFFTFGEIDFGEPYRTLNGVSGITCPGGISNPSVSGSISGFDFFQLNPGPVGTSGLWHMKAKHIYDSPGYFIITTKFIDSLGMTHMRGFACDMLDAGSIESLPTAPQKGVDYPAVDISGIPRKGEVPNSLFVDFDIRASGDAAAKLFPERDAFVNKINATQNPNTNSFIQWNFGNGNTTSEKDPFSYYQNPGFYIPVFRYQFKHPSGTLLATSGAGVSGLDPMYGDKSIWLSESLLIGFNT